MIIFPVQQISLLFLSISYFYWTYFASQLHTPRRGEISTRCQNFRLIISIIILIEFNYFLNKNQKNMFNFVGLCRVTLSCH
jgi:hypothetical protein